MIRRLLVVLAGLSLAAALAGCDPPPAPAEPPVKPGVNLDPCSERLHDLISPLMLYFAVHKELPYRLTDLPGVQPETLVCPISGKPYVYDRAGLVVTDWPGLLIVYDAEPCHAGRRWGIQADELPQSGQPWFARVANPAEKAIQWRTPAAAGKSN